MAHMITPIKVEIMITDICYLENILDVVKKIKEKYPDLIVQIKVQ